MRWLNQSQPQTLHSATMLAYFRAVFLLLGVSSGVAYRLLLAEILDNIGLGQFGWDIAPYLVAIGLALGGLGIANDRRIGYHLCSTMAVYTVVAGLYFMQRTSGYSDMDNLVRLMFDIVLVVSSFHPMSRAHRKVWFK